jgi:hypothetical protein
MLCGLASALGFVGTIFVFVVSIIRWDLSPWWFFPVCFISVVMLHLLAGIYLAWAARISGESQFEQ